MAAESPVKYKLRKVSQRRVTFPLTSQSLCFLLNQHQVILFYRSVVAAEELLWFHEKKSEVALLIRLPLDRSSPFRADKSMEM